MVDEYFEYIQGEWNNIVQVGGNIERVMVREAKKATITGLAFYMGFESRQSFYDYEKSGKYSYVCKRARLRVEECYELNLHGTTPTGSIFALKNMGWADKSIVDTTSGGKPLSNSVQVEIVYTKHNAPPDPSPEQ